MDGYWLMEFFSVFSKFTYKWTPQTNLAGLAGSFHTSLENGYNWKEMLFSAPKWASQASQISLGDPFICKLWENGKKFHEPSMDHTLKLDFVKIIYLE